jgi:hypothetical protein
VRSSLSDESGAFILTGTGQNNHSSHSPIARGGLTGRSSASGESSSSKTSKNSERSSKSTARSRHISALYMNAASSGGGSMPALGELTVASSLSSSPSRSRKTSKSNQFKDQLPPIQTQSNSTTLSMNAASDDGDLQINSKSGVVDDAHNVSSLVPSPETKQKNKRSRKGSKSLSPIKKSTASHHDPDSGNEYKPHSGLTDESFVSSIDRTLRRRKEAQSFRLDLSQPRIVDAFEGAPVISVSCGFSHTACITGEYIYLLIFTYNCLSCFE